MPASTAIEIIDALNKGGRQGPQDLLSAECHGWVLAHLAIPYADYEKLILENTIPESERATNRTAFFFQNARGAVSLHKTTADEIRPYVCRAIADLPASDANTTNIILRTKAIFPDFTSVDLMNQNNLGSAQQRIDQTIRNILLSNYDNKENTAALKRTNPDKKFLFSLKPAGAALAAGALTRIATAREEYSESEPTPRPSAAKKPTLPPSSPKKSVRTSALHTHPQPPQAAQKASVRQLTLSFCSLSTKAAATPVLSIAPTSHSRANRACPIFWRGTILSLWKCSVFTRQLTSIVLKTSSRSALCATASFIMARPMCAARLLRRFYPLIKRGSCKSALAKKSLRRLSGASTSVKPHKNQGRRFTNRLPFIIFTSFSSSALRRRFLQAPASGAA